MKKIIIFGATGNVGSYVHKYACEYFEGRYEVIASGHRRTDFFEKQGKKYVSVDISRAEEFAKLPQEDVYAVIDLAAQIPSYMKGYKPERYVQSNIMGAYNVLEYYLGREEKPVLDENGNQVYYDSGKMQGKPKFAVKHNR